MARNEEKHFSKLNRLLLQQQKEDEAKKNPRRPKLETLNTATDIKHWLPSIKKDIDFYLKQSKVSCYPEAKIKEFNDQIDRLRRVYQSFIWKLRQLDPQCGVIPWTERPYDTRKRPRYEDSVGTEGKDIEPAKVTRTVNSEDIELHTIVRENDDREQDPTVTFERIPLPVLESPAERQYADEIFTTEKLRSTKTRVELLNENHAVDETTGEISKGKDAEVVQNMTGVHKSHWIYNRETMDAPLNFKQASLSTLQAVGRQSSTNVLGLSYEDSSSEHSDQE